MVEEQPQDITDKVYNAERVKGLHASYTGHGGMLRSWLVAFGAGVPALFITQEWAWNALAASGNAFFLALLYFSGVLLQVFHVIASKYANYYGFLAQFFPSMKEGRFPELVKKFTWQWKLDLAVDLLSLTLLVSATLLASNILIEHASNKALQPTVQPLALPSGG